MKFKYLLSLLVLLPVVADAANPRSGARVGVQRAPVSRSNNATSAAALKQQGTVATVKAVTQVEQDYTEQDYYDDEYEEVYADEGSEIIEEQASPAPKSCRDAYRSCMDEFCLLDESEGYRCACSSKINASKSLIQEIQKIQDEADKLYTEGVERANLGAKARILFGESAAAKKSSRASGLSFAEWLNSGSDDEDSLDSDEGIGDNLYAMASEFCSAELEACGDKAEMEEVLYGRQITADCKAYGLYLADQKRYAEQNKTTAQAAVRQAELAMLSTTRKYNRGECLIAYKACVADKGGCGINFENCLDADLLARRSNACEDVLDYCDRDRDIVLQDWESEMEDILADAAKYADQNRRMTCRAKIRVCLEDGCSYATDSACLTDVNVAAGICPIIDECNELVPGLKETVKSELAYLRTHFCQNDVDACLRDRCGANFTAPECIGKSPQDIVALCPQSMFPSCKNETQYDIIVSAAVLDLDYKMMQGCINYFAEKLGQTCGTDMACLPQDSRVASLKTIPETTDEMDELNASVREHAKAQVEEFFKKFENEKTVAACVSAQQPDGRRAQMGDSVFSSAKKIAEINAENRALRQLEAKIAELSRQQSLEKAEQNCYAAHKVEKPDSSAKNVSYVTSVTFEPALRNCHVCYAQRVCETGGENGWTAGVKGAAGGLAAGAAMGTQVSPGWGTLIGGVVGAVGTGLVTGLSAKEQEFCQEKLHCDDVNY
ncbi:MAG: hypothetical protein R8N24_01215 [Alphaproteobacteria bacterium]|nr:hypothetical protein [Alphaproteobacteria bacterium]